MSESVIELIIEGKIAHVILNRPNARNALNLAMCNRLTTIMEELDFNPDIHVIIIRGNGPSFCAGADMKERKGKEDTWILKRRQASFRAYSTIARSRKPVIAVVHGNVIGSGGEIAMSCDFIIAAEDTNFRFPEAHWGTIGATQRLQRVIGISKAKELLFTNRILSVKEALQNGLVSRVVPLLKLNEEAVSVSLEIAKAPKDTVELTKQCVDLGALTDLDGGIRIELAAIEKNLMSGKWKVGFDAFNSMSEQDKL